MPTDGAPTPAVNAADIPPGLYVKGVTPGHPIPEPIIRTFRHPFERVCKQFFNKYPCEKHPEVTDAKIIRFHVDENTGVESRTRKFTVSMESKAPWWVLKMFGDGNMYVHEDSVLDPRARTLVVNSRNISFSSMFLAVERSTFHTHPDNPQHTHFEQEGYCHASSYWGPFKGTMERFTSHLMHREGIKACDLLDELLDQNQFN